MFFQLLSLPPPPRKIVVNHPWMNRPFAQTNLHARLIDLQGGILFSSKQYKRIIKDGKTHDKYDTWEQAATILQAKWTHNRNVLRNFVCKSRTTSLTWAALFMWPNVFLARPTHGLFTNICLPRTIKDYHLWENIQWRATKSILHSLTGQCVGRLLLEFHGKELVKWQRTFKTV